MNIQETLQQKLGKEIAQASNEEIYGALLSRRACRTSRQYQPPRKRAYDYRQELFSEDQHEHRKLRHHFLH